MEQHGTLRRPPRVVVGVRDSLAGLAALRHAITEARRTGRTLVAVLAWEPPEGEALYRRRPEPSWAALWEKDARRRLEGAFEEAAGGIPADLTVVRRVVRGAPGPVLCAVADHPGDLLVLGAARPGRRTARLHRRPVHGYVLGHAVSQVLTVAGPHLRPAEARALRRSGKPARDATPRMRRWAIRPTG